MAVESVVGVAHACLMTRGRDQLFVDPEHAANSVADALEGVRGDVVVCGPSAAALWGMPLPPGVAARIRTDGVVVSSGPKAAVLRRKGVHGHSLDVPEGHSAVLNGVRVTSPARTWLDCAAFMAPDHLLAMGDWTLNHELMKLSEISGLVTWARRRRGVVRARQVLPWLRVGAESPQESRLRWMVVADQLPEPSINPEIVLPNQRLVRLDLAYVAFRIGLEFDGDWHVGTQRHDEERRRLLTACGWKVIVADKEDLHNPARVLREVHQALKDRRVGARPIKW